jgi:hypothetical protein
MSEERDKGRRYIDPKRTWCVHPDMLSAFHNYNGTDDSFKEVMKVRREKTEKGEPYWDTTHDREMAETAELRSKHPLFKFPARKKK